MITGNEFKQIRELKGLSLRDIAKFCDVSAQLIGMIENNKRNFTDDTYKQIITAMNLATAAKANGELDKKSAKK